MTGLDGDAMTAARESSSPDSLRQCLPLHLRQAREGSTDAATKSLQIPGADEDAMTAAQRVLGIPELLRQIFLHLSKKDTFEFEPKSAIYVNRLWFEEGTLFIWRDCSKASLMAVADPARRQFYANRIISIYDSSPSEGLDMSCLNFPALKAMIVVYNRKGEWVPSPNMLRKLIFLKLDGVSISQKTLFRVHESCPSLERLDLLGVDLLRSESEHAIQGEHASEGETATEGGHVTDGGLATDGGHATEGRHANEVNPSSALKDDPVKDPMILRRLDIAWTANKRASTGLPLYRAALPLFNAHLINMGFNNVSRECASRLVRCREAFSVVKDLQICLSPEAIPVLAPALHQIEFLKIMTRDGDLADLEAVGTLRKLGRLSIIVHNRCPRLRRRLLRSLPGLPELATFNIQRADWGHDGYEDMEVPIWSDERMQEYLARFPKLVFWDVHDVPRETRDPEAWSNAIFGSWRRWTRFAGGHTWERTTLEASYVSPSWR